jgi:hypothetical protein
VNLDPWIYQKWANLDPWIYQKWANFDPRISGYTMQRWDEM